MFLNGTAMLIFLLLSSTTLADDKKPIDGMKILGKWCSVKLEGDDIGITSSKSVLSFKAIKK